MARKAGFRVDENTAAQQVKANIFGLQIMRDRLHQGFFVPVGDSFGPFVLGYILLALDAEHYQADINTDTAVMYLRHLQSPDGQWAFPAGDARPPLCSLYIGQTALSMRALQLYAPKAGKADFDESIRRAAAWLAKARSANNDDRGWRVIGLAWAGTDKNAMRTAMQELLAKQRSDGGWSDLDSMESSAYATGKAWSRCRLQGCRFPMTHTNAVFASCSRPSRRTDRGTSRRVRWRFSRSSMPGSLTASINGSRPRARVGRRWRSHSHRRRRRRNLRM